MSMYERCRWCKYFAGEVCSRGFAEPSVTTDQWIYDVEESGRLHEAVKEAVGSTYPQEMIGILTKTLHDWGISKKRQEEFKNKFRTCFEHFLEEQMVDAVCEDVARLYRSRCGESAGTDLVIKEPSTFCCKYFE